MKTIEMVKTRYLRLLNENSETENYDYRTLENATSQFKELEDKKVKPHLITVYGNMWEVFHDLNDECMEILGYEYVGRMSNDFKEDGETYIFKSQDEVYDMLYRLKDPKISDFTNHIRIEF